MSAALIGPVSILREGEIPGATSEGAYPENPQRTIYGGLAAETMTVLRLLWIGLLIAAMVAVGTRLLVAVGLPVGRVTSWWRDPWRNRMVGGRWWSAHVLGWAVDVAPVTVAGDLWLHRVFPVVVNEGDHLHAAWFRAPE